MKPTANTIQDGENGDASFSRSGMRPGFPLAALVVNIIVQLLARAISQQQQQKEAKGIQTRQGKVQLSLLTKEKVKLPEITDDSILHSDAPQKTLVKGWLHVGWQSLKITWTLKMVTLHFPYLFNVWIHEHSPSCYSIGMN